MDALRRTLRVFAASLVVTMLALALFVQPAFAREYSIDKVDIDATIETDGSLTVIETRTFDFDGHFNGVYWEIAEGAYEGRNIDVEVLGAGVVNGDSVTLFDNNSSEANNTYQVVDNYGSVKVTLYSAHDDEEVQFVIKYKLTNAVGAYDDVAELYWKFVSDGWDVESQNVTCTVHLPVPVGESVTPEGNVRAWGHGALDAELHFDGNDVVYTVPGVGTAEFAEARITFPPSWVPGAPKLSGSVLDSIIAEETEWANEANEQRQKAIEHQKFLGVLGTGSAVVGVAGAAGVIGFALKKKKEYKETHQTLFDDDYFRDVPTGDHPAVLATLAGSGMVPSEGLTATLMRLTDMHRINLEKRTFVKDRLILGDKQYEDYCITFNELEPVDPIQGVVARQANDIDQKAVDFIDWLARKAGDPAMLQFSSVKTTAKKKPEAYKNRYEKWENLVEQTYTKRFVSTESTGAGVVGAVAAGAIIVGIGIICAMILMDWPLMPTVVGGAALILGGIIAAGAALSFDNLNAEGREVQAKLEALKRWFKDFTRLKEAVPHDVILWNRLLVLAVALGVSEEVIKQLKIAAPEILDDPMMRDTYCWYMMSSTMGTPASVFASAMQEAHSVSEAALASSSMSSGGGGGGGFSGGGGGGFGGGGGGGAF